MNRYAHIDENNIVKGWYDDDHPTIPEPYITITEEQWMNGQTKMVLLQNWLNK